MTLDNKLKSMADAVGFCKAADLEKMPVKWSLPIYDYARKPAHYMKKATTVIIIGCAAERKDDIFRRSILGDDYPGYKKANQAAKDIRDVLNCMGHKAKVAGCISLKNAAILAGIGVWGKNALIVNKEHGTMLRFSAVVTDWVPEYYGNPAKQDLCAGCYSCINACPYSCLMEFKVNARKCFCKYLKHGQLSMEIPMCSICQDVCKYNAIKRIQE